MTNLATIITQGDELTSGSVLNTNAQWLAEQLTAHGWTVRTIITVPDSIKDLSARFKMECEKSDIIISSGGLGPTDDDHTRTAFSDAFSCPLVLNIEARTHIQNYCRTRQRPNEDKLAVMAQLPEGSTLLPNPVGSAVGFFKRISGCTFYFFPGVPTELKRMVSDSLLPLLPKGNILLQKTFLCIGQPEAELQRRLSFIEPPHSIGYRASRTGNLVKLYGPPLSENILSMTRQVLSDCCAAEDEVDLAKSIGSVLSSSGETVATAESCTAGQVAAWLASVPGASAYLLEGAIVYSNEAKQKYTGVKNKTLQEHGAVSMETARELATGIRERAGTTWGLSVTGIAGPSGGTPTKPVGTVHIAVAGPDNILTHKHLRLHGTRAQITQASATELLFLLLQVRRASAAN